MSEQKVLRSVEQCIVIKFLVGEKVPSAEIHHRLQQQYEQECLHRRHSCSYWRCSTLRGTFCSLITLATPRQDWTGSNPSRREGGGCGFTLSRSHSCCAVRLVYTQNSPGHIWTTLYVPVMQQHILCMCFFLLRMLHYVLSLAGRSVDRPTDSNGLHVYLHLQMGFPSLSLLIFIYFPNLMLACKKLTVYPKIFIPQKRKLL